MTSPSQQQGSHRKADCHRDVSTVIFSASVGVSCGGCLLDFKVPYQSKSFLSAKVSVTRTSDFTFLGILKLRKVETVQECLLWVHKEAQGSGDMQGTLF